MTKLSQGVTRALIVKKPHIDNILDNGKVWEMRSSRTNISERIALIESGSGLIVGEVNLGGSIGFPITERLAERYKYKHQVEDLSLLKKWKWPWLLGSPERFDKPIPYNHPKGAMIWVDLTKDEVLTNN